MHVSPWTRDGRGLIEALAVGNRQTERIEDGYIVRTNLSGAGTRIIGRHMNFPVISPDGRVVTAWSGNGTRIFTLGGRRVRHLAKMGVLAWVPRRR